MDNNTKYQNALIYVSLVLLACVYAAVTAVSFLCYLPYSLIENISGNMHRVLWFILIFPVIAVSITLFLANILNKKLKNTTVVFILTGMLFFSLGAFFYGKYDYTAASYFVSPISFLLVSAISSCVVWDLWGGREIKRRLFWIIGTLLLLILLILSAFMLFNYTVITDLLGHIVVLSAVPLYCGISFVVSVISALSSALTKLSVGLCYIVSAFGVMYTAFPFMYGKTMRTAFTVGAVLVAVTVLSDIVNSIKKYKEKKENDS